MSLFDNAEKPGPQAGYQPMPAANPSLFDAQQQQPMGAHTQYAPMGAPVAGQPVTGQPYMLQQPGFAPQQTNPAHSAYAASMAMGGGMDGNNNGMAYVAMQRQQQQQQGGGGGFGGGAFMGGGGPVGAGGGRQMPDGMQVGADGVDVCSTSGGAMRIKMMVGGIMLLVSIIILVAFGASGMFGFAPYAGIGPAICLIIGLGFICTMKIEKLYFNHSNRTMKQSVRWIVLPCFTTGDTVSYDQITGVNTEMSSVRVNGMPMMYVKMTCQGRGAISLGTVNFLEADALANTWRAYLNTVVTPQ